MSYSHNRMNKPHNKFFSDNYGWALPACWSAIMLAVIARSWTLCDGHLLFSLDDPIIHMSVSESILNGEYGINTGEAAAPSSSILWPFLLAGPEWAGLGTWGPLGFNIIAMLGVVMVIGRALRKFLPARPQSGLSSYAWFISHLGIGLLVCMAINSWGLVMTGLEHSLHVLLSLMFMSACHRLVDRPNEGGRCFVVIAGLLPMIRFEGAALACVGLILLLFYSRWRLALSLGVLLAAEVSAWAWFMHSRGLPFMPSSVQMKSSLVAGAMGHETWSSVFDPLFYTIKVAFACRQGAMLLVLLTILGVMIIRTRYEGRLGDACFGAAALISGLAHVVFGQFGWFSRYEIYILAVVIYAILALGRNWWNRPDALFGMVGILVIIGAFYVKTFIDTPPATRSLFQQQYQMRRFAVDFWKKPVAVNDLGWVSYHNPFYVLDLEGLGSETVRKLHRSKSFNADSISALTNMKNVELAMVYDERVARYMPAGWIKVAVLRTSVVATTSDKLCFYLKGQAKRDELVSALAKFSAGLPVGSKVELMP